MKLRRRKPVPEWLRRIREREALQRCMYEFGQRLNFIAAAVAAKATGEGGPRLH